jgi:fatty-acyl-CoA synthase
MARGVEIVQGYGLTEAAPNVLCLPPEDASRKLGFAGRPYPHVDVALRDLETGTLLEGPATGELLVRGPNVFPGYWRNPEATADAFVDGWLLTGDIAERDAEGYYRIAGRLKDLVISGGENVYPAQVEDVLHAHPAIAEAAVIGIPDERWGEVCVAYVVLRPGLDASEEQLLEWCAQRLARFKVPRAFHVIDALPRSGVGKVLKGELRAAWEGARR